MPAPAFLETRDFRRLARDYRAAWPVRLAAVDPAGQRLLAGGWWRGPDPPDRRAMMAFVIAEGLRWGEPTITYGPAGNLFWAVPIMHNARLLGGLVATIHEDTLFPGQTSRPTADLRQACTALRHLAERENLTNAALLEQRRWQYVREQQRAELLQSSKADAPLRVRQLYLLAEPELMNAIRRADRPHARAVLNQMLTALINAAGERFVLVRSFCIELVALMSRTAVETGADPDHLFGAGHHDLSHLAAAADLEALSQTLSRMLERTIDSLETHRSSVESLLIANAVSHLREHLDQPLSRDGIAEMLNISPSHFSRLFRSHTGHTFTSLLTRLRVERASELLARTDLPPAAIARRCGFPDRSYLGKVFRRVTGQTPRAYRAAHRPPPPGV